MNFVVMTDTSSNLPTSLVREYDLKEIAFSYFIEGKEYQCLDTAAFDAEDYYAKIKKGMRVTTSQIAPQTYMDFYEPFLKQGLDVIYVCMSSGISGSCNSAVIGARELMESYPGRRIEVIDTRGAALGEGLIALEAARMRDQNVGTELAAARLRLTAERMFNVFTVDDLMHLHRGGRLSNVSALIGTVLQIKPILKGNEEGKIVAFAKVRGRKASVKMLAQMYDKLVVEPEKQMVGIVQAACRDEAEELAQMLRRNRPPREILTIEYEPVTGSYVGPGALALFFESEEGVRSYNGESMAGLMKQAVAKAGETASGTLQRLRDAGKK